MKEGWISIENSTPPYDSHFLACWKSGNMSVLWFWATTWEDLTTIPNKNKPNLLSDEVTHWQRLPELPEDLS